MGVDVRRWCVGFAAALMAAGSLVAPAVANADYGQAEETYAGSQIARHEGAGVARLARSAARGGGMAGHDVSGYQGNVDWPRAWSSGARFVYIKATEGTRYVNPRFAQQYNGSYQAGMIRGA